MKGLARNRLYGPDTRLRNGQRSVGRAGGAVTRSARLDGVRERAHRRRSLGDELDTDGRHERLDARRRPPIAAPQQVAHGNERAADGARARALGRPPVAVEALRV